MNIVHGAKLAVNGAAFIGVFGRYKKYIAGTQEIAFAVTVDAALSVRYYNKYVVMVGYTPNRVSDNGIELLYGRYFFEFKAVEHRFFSPRYARIKRHFLQNVNIV